MLLQEVPIGHRVRVFGVSSKEDVEGIVLRRIGLGAEIDVQIKVGRRKMTFSGNRQSIDLGEDNVSDKILGSTSVRQTHKRNTIQGRKESFKSR